MAEDTQTRIDDQRDNDNVFAREDSNRNLGSSTIRGSRFNDAADTGTDEAQSTLLLQMLATNQQELAASRNLQFQAAQNAIALANRVANDAATLSNLQNNNAAEASALISRNAITSNSQASHNTVNHAQASEHQARGHRDIAADRMWNVDEHNQMATIAAKALNDADVLKAIQAAIAKAVQDAVATPSKAA